MAALTASQTLRESGGSLTRWIIQFTSVNNGDTYTAAFGTSVVDYFAVSHATAITKSNSGIIAIYDNVNTFTFQTGLGGQSATLFVYARD